MTIITLDFPPYTQERTMFATGAQPPERTEPPAPPPPEVATDAPPPDETNFKSDVVNAIKTQVKASANKALDATEETVESIAQHKYARLANASYDYFNSKGNPDAVAEGLQDPKYSYIDDLAGFEVDKELSTIDNLVLHNPQTGETVVSYRGTTDNPLGETRNFLNDWKTNAQISGGKTNTQRVREADRQMDEVIAKYGKDELRTVGHSQGGHISFEMGQKYDVPSYSYNPAINTKQVARTVEGEAEHVIFKTPLDFASPLAYKKMPGVKTEIVKNIKGMDSVVGTHSIDQFTPEVQAVEGDSVRVMRRTMMGSVAKGVGHALNVAAYGYTVGSKISEDVKAKETALKTTADVAVETEKFVVDGEILGAALAAAPETLGISLVVGAAAVYIHDHLADKAEDTIVEGANTVAKTTVRAANKVSRWFKNHLF